MRQGALTLLALGALIIFIPDRTLDPWHLLNLKTISSILFALFLIQIIGIKIANHLGSRATTVMTGFLGGLVSSTVVTVALARKSHLHVHGEISSETIGFLAATTAMLIEGLTIVLLSNHVSGARALPLFLLPILTALTLIVLHTQTTRKLGLLLPISSFRLRPMVELGLGIVVILVISRFFLQAFGTAGLLLQTFITSLFEVHAPIIVSLQLHEARSISHETFMLLICSSLSASFISKIIIASVLGSSQFKKRILKCTLSLTASLLAGLGVGLAIV